MSADPVLDLNDISTLFCILHALEDRCAVVLRYDGMQCFWPADLADLPRDGRLLQRVTHLRRNGWLDVEAVGSRAPCALRPSHPQDRG
jgi:hypothetical protein